VVNTAVIAPEPARGINPQTTPALDAASKDFWPARPLLPLLLRTLALSVVIFGLLELWRPYFFLTDDNLDGGFPVFSEIGHNILAGQSPFVSHHLFGGNYDLLRDPTFFSWHPVYLLNSLLVGMPLHLAIIDANAFFMLMLATAGFVVLAHHLRREMPLGISDNWITFYALSYTYTMIALTTGASWSSFLGNVASLPWLALGVFQKSWWRGAGIVALFVMNQTLGGHLAPTVSNSIFLSVFAVGLSFGRRSAVPLAIWFGGYALALVIMSPLLVHVAEGFIHSGRANGVDVQDMGQNNIPLEGFLPSILLGMGLWIFHPNGHPYVTYTLALGSCAAAWCLLPALASRARWRGTEGMALFMVIFGAVMVIRPMFITEFMAQVPILKSLRWPFRELIQFQFFFHLFLVVRPPGFSRNGRRLCAAFGTFVYGVPLVLYPFAPTFNTMTWDRELIISGRYKDYWAHVERYLKPGDRIAVVIPLELYTDDRFEEPYCLLGTCNYACIDGIINVWGYSPTAPLDRQYTVVNAYYPFGAYHPAAKKRLMKLNPEVKIIALESLDPLRITLSSSDGTVVDLTPFVPPRESKIPPHPRGLP